MGTLRRSLPVKHNLYRRTQQERHDSDEQVAKVTPQRCFCCFILVTIHTNLSHLVASTRDMAIVNHAEAAFVHEPEGLVEDD